MSEKLLREALKAFDDGLGHLGRDILGTLIERAEQVQPAQSPQPAVPVVSDEQIRKMVESIQDPDTVPAFHNGYYTLTPGELRRAILTLRPAVEPMTLEQINEMALQEEFLLVCDGVEELTEIVRAVEAHHNITAKAEGGA